MKNKGMIIGELLIALVIVTTMLTTVVFTIVLNDNMQMNIKIGAEAVGLAQGMIVDVIEEELTDIEPFNETEGLFNKFLTVTFHSPYKALIKSTISWGNNLNQKVEKSFWYIDDNFISDVVDCSPLHDSWVDSLEINHSAISLPPDMKITDALIYKDYLYISTDSSTVSDSDLYAININDPLNPFVATSTHTGPGIASMSRRGDFLFIANTGVNQMQVISIEKSDEPKLMTEIKLPGVIVSGGTGVGRSGFVVNDYFYLGLSKANGPEMFLIDISDPAVPIVEDSAEIDSSVSDISVGYKYLAISNATEESLIILDSNSLNKIDGYTFPNWNIQSGQRVFVLGHDIYFGRNTTGISTKYPELIKVEISNATTTMISLGSSVDTLNISDNNIFVSTYSDGNTDLQIINQSTYELIKKHEITGRGVKTLCDENYLYIIVNDPVMVFNLFKPHE